MRREEPPTEEDLHIFIKDKPYWGECDFWVMFYPHGSLHSREVIHAKTFRDIFAQVSRQGISDSQTLLYVDNSSERDSLYLLFYPETRFKKEEEWEQWLDNLVALLANTYPKALGLYFGEEISRTQNMKARLVCLIDRLMAENIALNSLTLLNITQSGEHLVESAEYARKSLRDQYNIAVNVAS